MGLLKGLWKMKTLILCIIVGLPALAQSNLQGQGKLTVIIENLRSNKGSVGVSLHNLPEAFPGDASKSVKSAFAPIREGVARVVFEGIPVGNYAVAVFHDENEDRKLNSNMFGIPREGYGTSRDAKGFMGPPKFENAAFEIRQSPVSIQIKMVY